MRLIKCGTKEFYLGTKEEADKYQTGFCPLLWLGAPQAGVFDLGLIGRISMGDLATALALPSGQFDWDTPQAWFDAQLRKDPDWESAGWVWSYIGEHNRFGSPLNLFEEFKRVFGADIVAQLAAGEPAD